MVTDGRCNILGSKVIIAHLKIHFHGHQFLQLLAPRSSFADPIGLSLTLIAIRHDNSDIEIAIIPRRSLYTASKKIDRFYLRYLLGPFDDGCDPMNWDHHKSISSRRGSSSDSFTRTRKVTASLPSMTRWS